MRKLTITLMLIGIAALMISVGVAGEEAKTEAKKEEGPKHEYVGAKKCKICHKDVYNSWLKTSHATAMDKLSAEEQKKPECVGCHMTGHLADGTMIPHVECEACHGPGKDYKSPKIMSKKKWPADPEKHKKMAIEAGLIYPVEEDCTRCHRKEGNDNFKPFDFEKRKGEVHPVAAKGK